MRRFLITERDRLDALALSRCRDKAIDQDNLSQEIPALIRFSEEYQKYYMGYLKAVLPQHLHGVRCGPHCGNCCKHFPMSVEPFELISFYAVLRRSDMLLDFLEKCVFRVHRFRFFMDKACSTGGDDPEEQALHEYFAEGNVCPFILSNGSCGVYEQRPVTCRMYFSETDPKYCGPAFLQSENNAVLLFIFR
jgi:Fe-S-cluster containining protein